MLRGCITFPGARRAVRRGTVDTIRFAIWDAGNALFDSTVLVDNFHWIATGAVPVSTQPQPTPQ
jgi:hypothetical protein